jgi:hypothetical protein
MRVTVYVLLFVHNLGRGVLQADIPTAEGYYVFWDAHAAMDSQQLEAELADLQSYMQSAQPQQQQCLKQTITVRASWAICIINR